MSSIWDDINYVNTMKIDDGDYDIEYLGDCLYELIESTPNIKDIKYVYKGASCGSVKYLFVHPLAEKFTEKEFVGFVLKVKAHAEQLKVKDEMKTVLNVHFTSNIELLPADYVFINSYLPKIYRAKIEQEVMGKDLLSGLVICGYEYGEIDEFIVETMRSIRAICKYLGVPSTIEVSTFPLDKLTSSAFWDSVYGKFINLFGEENIETHYTTPYHLVSRIFYLWSGSIVYRHNNKFHIQPAMFINRLVQYLKFSVQYNK